MSETTSDFTEGDLIRVTALPSYVKTAEPMPMLRPPSVISLGEEGTILRREPGEYWAIRFERGAFLLERQYFEIATADTVSEEPSENNSTIAPLQKN
ncbi:MAG: regulatory protein SipA [Thermosynechococcaceae cyanobacterium]